MTFFGERFVATFYHHHPRVLLIKTYYAREHPHLTRTHTHDALLK